MRGHLALRGNQHHDETLRCGLRKISFGATTTHREPADSSNMSGYCEPDAANPVHVGVVKLNSRVKVGWGVWIPDARQRRFQCGRFRGRGQLCCVCLRAINTITRNWRRGTNQRFCLWCPFSALHRNG